MANKSLQKYKMFDTTKEKVRLIKDESAEFDKEKEKREKQMKELALIIKNKSNKSFIDALEEKYAPKKQKVELKNQTEQKKGKKDKRK
jgi:hypothetical protein